MSNEVAPLRTSPTLRRSWATRSPMPPRPTTRWWSSSHCSVGRWLLRRISTWAPRSSTSPAVAVRLYLALDAVGPDGSVLGIDLAAGMVEQLNAELAAKGIRNAKARVGDAEELDLPDGSFDVVTGGFMIFFPPDPPRVIGSCAGCWRRAAPSPCQSSTARPAPRGWMTSRPSCSAHRRRCRTRSSTRQQCSTTP